jgi:exodeoxyribonuclease V beta subunit
VTTLPPPTRVDELDLAGDLPTGTVVLQASAGTGKTYAIAALVTRAVAEGVCTLPELLVVTFTRAATAELRDRVRRRLVEAERHLRAVLAGTATAAHAGDDAVLAHLADADPAELRARQERLSAALTDFDAATISTIHGFTQQVLRSVGLAADVPRELTLLEDETDLIDEVTDDVYVRRYLGRADVPTRPKRAEVAAMARIIAGNGDAEARPSHDDPDPAGAERGAIARDLGDELAARKRRDGTLGYDDLLLALRAALRDPDRGDAAVAILRERYHWALIDEFQDTDPVQWDILARAFRDPAEPSRALVLIGDPKQAIYSFRGADVRAYLAATRIADRQLSLATNYRSDGPLLSALDGLLAGTTFGEDDIAFASVRPSDAHRAGALVDDHDPAALQLRAYDPPYAKGNAPAVRQRLAEDVAATLLDQLGRVRIGADEHPLRPEDVAVLVRSNAEARLVQQTLRDVRIPSVVNGVGSVLATDAADDWRWLLEALERPSDPQRMRRLALSAWVGWDATQLADADEDALDDLHATAHRWAQLLTEHGVASLERTVLGERQVAARLLRTLGGERHLTDLRHVGALLHTAGHEADRGVSSLRSWLLRARAEAGDTATPSEEQARRLESDAAAVQILTIHRAKGLQYPVVLVPFLWSAGQGVRAPLVTHDPATGGRVIDLGPSDRPGFDELKGAAQRDATGELLRLLYVAVTRAQHRVVVWWQAARGSPSSPLGRVLFGRDEEGRVELDRPADVPRSGSEQLAAISERFAGPHTSVSAVPGPDEQPLATWRPEERDQAPLAAARFDRTLDRAWRRTSYSAIVKRVEHVGDPTAPALVAPVVSEPEVTAKDDEPDEPDEPVGIASAAHGAGGGPGAEAEAGPGPTLDAPVPLEPLRGGTTFGTFVHAVLEHTDFAAPDLVAEVAQVVETERQRHRVPGLSGATVPVLTDGLVTAIRSPLGPLAGRVPAGRWRQLADVPTTDRLDELEFELPLAGGDAGRPGGTSVALSSLADILDRPAAHGGLGDDDPIRRVRYADRLRDPGFALDLRGYLNGSIDVVLRVHDEAGPPRFLVVDHKTNRLGGDEPTVRDYRPDALVDAMVDHDYPLQALLYQVALHRFLRWRVDGYDPATHLGGVLYLFVRGMVGPDTPEVDGGPCGVFAWRPPATVVTALSDLLDGVGVAPTSEVAS